MSLWKDSSVHFLPVLATGRILSNAAAADDDDAGGRAIMLQYIRLIHARTNVVTIYTFLWSAWRMCGGACPITWTWAVISCRVNCCRTNEVIHVQVYLNVTKITTVLLECQHHCPERKNESALQTSAHVYTQCPVHAILVPPTPACNVYIVTSQGSKETCRLQCYWPGAVGWAWNVDGNCRIWRRAISRRVMENCVRPPLWHLRSYRPIVPPGPHG